MTNSQRWKSMRQNARNGPGSGRVVRCCRVVRNRNLIGDFRMFKDLSLLDALGRFRLIALLEGTSYLLLLFIAMPLKYMMDMPQMVTWVGRAHGLLFVLYVLAGISVAIDRRWSVKLMAG